MDLAPILVSVYNRKDHLTQCINSLLSNDLAKDCVLYIVSDAAFKIEHEGSIKEVRNYISTIRGFKQVNLIERKENYGSYRSIVEAFNFVINTHGKIIFLEDDVSVSKNFLKYINDGLNYYYQYPKIFAITGYSYPVDYPDSVESTFIWQGNSPWGFGTWKSKWDFIDIDIKDYPSYFKNKKLYSKLEKVAPSAFMIFLLDRFGSIKAMDARIYFNLVKNDMFVLFPKFSLTKNIGHDGTGEHCGKTDIFSNQNIDSEYSIIFDPMLKENMEVNHLLSNYFRISKKDYISYNLLKYKLYGIYKINRRAINCLKKLFIKLGMKK
jgi:hypothetical protein